MQQVMKDLIYSSSLLNPNILQDCFFKTSAIREIYFYIPFAVVPGEVAGESFSEH